MTDGPGPAGGSVPEADASVPPDAPVPAPDGSAPALRALDPRAITLWQLHAMARSILPLGLLTAAPILLELPVSWWALLAAGLAATAAWVAWVPALRYRAWGFALREDDVYLRRGVLIRATSIVPHARIQHVDTRHGPLDRWLGLASLVLYTAGTQGAVVAIPALEAGEAESLRDRLAALSGAGDAV